MNTSANFDAIEQLIFDEHLRIESVDVKADADTLLVVLNTKAVLQFPLSSFRSLAKGDKEAIKKYEIIASGTGIHWPMLDEDLSLKGFLQESLKQTIRNAAA